MERDLHERINGWVSGCGLHHGLSKNKDSRKRGTMMEIDKERNRMALERISFHLGEAMRFCSQLDLSGLGPLEQGKWASRMKTCKNAIEFSKESVQKLDEILE